MAQTKNGNGKSKHVDALKHAGAKRKNIPTAEYQSAAEQMEEVAPVGPVHYPRTTPLAKSETRPRDPDLDPQIVWNGARIRLSPEQVRILQETAEIEIGDAQLVWHGKDQQDWSDLVVQPPQIFIQEKIQPKVIIDDLIRRAKEKNQRQDEAPDLFADFNGLPDAEARLEFYQHDQYWSNRMILGDSLQVMASLAERERLRSKVQCIYIDPPYGIKFNSNWQVSTLSRDVKDGKIEDVSREPEVVKAFRDTWKNGIHSYLTYLRDRLTAARDLLTDSGSVFVQIGEENVHKVRNLLDEIFGDRNFVSQVSVFKTTTPRELLDNNLYYILWYAKDVASIKYRQTFVEKPLKEWTSETKGGSWGVTIEDVDRPLTPEEKADPSMLPKGAAVYQLTDMFSAGIAKQIIKFTFRGIEYNPRPNTHWKTTNGLQKLTHSNRIEVRGGRPWFKRYYRDWPMRRLTNVWSDTSGKASERIYVVQTQDKVIERCVLVTTDPGDLVLDPTCGSGTTAFLAEQWGRRWITIDSSRVALALARARLMGASYAYYLLSDSVEGRAQEQKVTGKIQPDMPTHNDIRQGFVYERAPHVTLKSIANNGEIDVIWEEYQQKLEPLRAQLNQALGKQWGEWKFPREADQKWTAAEKALHAEWWELGIARQKKIDASIARNADIELLYDRPYEDKSRVRVAGPFTVESLSPHRVVPADEEELLDVINADEGKRRRTKLITPPTDFAAMVLENLRTAGVQQSKKSDKLVFNSLTPWPGEYVNAEGHFVENGIERRAAIFIGPEFGTVSRVDLAAAAREATDARFHVLVACAFNFDAHASELSKLGPLPILKAKMNPDLHMGGELKNTGKGNLFVVFGGPKLTKRRGNRYAAKLRGRSRAPKPAASQ